MKSIFVIIDNGHGKDTPGKCSPDRTYSEWQWTRRAARRLAEKLTAAGVDCALLVPEERDVPLSERCRRANALVAAHPESVLVSIHTNASVASGWGSASGWSAFVCHGASAKAKALASAMTALAGEEGLKGNRQTPPVGYWKASFAILRGTRCPAVLTENLFHDNRHDLAILNSPTSVEQMAQIHFKALMQL